MAWPVEALLLLVALAGCLAAAAALQAGRNLGSIPLTISGVAILASLAAEVGQLNGDFGGAGGSGIGFPTILLGGAALAALALYLLLPPPEPSLTTAPVPTGPAANPDSEA
ncbi:MAG: hypothetical protein ACYCYK_11995 [Candidatus Dormibacteria bacterium]